MVLVVYMQTYESELPPMFLILNYAVFEFLMVSIVKVL